MEHLRRTARMDGLHELLSFVDEGARQSGFSEEARGRIRLAAEEALVNIILHAYPEAEGPVDVAWEKTGEPALSVEIRDSGSAFDPLAAEDPVLTGNLDERPIGGLGIFFIREATDRVRYRREGNDNVLTLTFLAP